MDENKMNRELNVEALKEKHGKVYEVSFEIQPDGETDVSRKYIFVKPKTASYDRYIKGVSQSMTKAMKAFVQIGRASCRVRV